jgi:hypothetical protein
MRKLNWKTASLGSTILVLLIVVLNPEIRAFLLLLDFLGADLAVLLLGGYIGQYWPIFVSHFRHAVGSFTSGTGSVFKSLRWIAYGLVPREPQWAQIDHLGIAASVATWIAVGRMRA